MPKVMEDHLQVRESARSREAKSDDTLCAPGQIAIPRDFLSRSEERTGLEFALIKTYPRVACDILSAITFSGNTGPIILLPHERLDGSAAPLGLKGKANRLDTETYLRGDRGGGS